MIFEILYAMQKDKNGNLIDSWDCFNRNLQQRKPMIEDNQYTCINDVFTAEQKEGFENLPVKNEDYTLKEEVISFLDKRRGFVFYELPNPCHPNGQEYSFRPSRFIKKGDTPKLKKTEKAEEPMTTEAF